MSAIDLIISCLNYLSYSINKYEIMAKQTILSESHTSAEDLQALHDSKQTHLTNMFREMDI